jgi:hypothetical protein
MGAFSIFLLAFLLFTTFCYTKAPKCIIAEKQEYVKFFLTFFILYFALDGISSLVIYNIFNYSPQPCILPIINVLLLCPALFVYHLAYPFKNVKRNQHLSFFLFFASLLSACVGLFVIGLENM